MSDDWPTVISRVLARIRLASAPSEGSDPNNGAFSYHAETHAAGMGLGIGLTAGATGDWQYLGIALAAVTSLNRGETVLDAKVLEDMRQEPHYLLGGLFVGVVVGRVVRGV